MDFVGLNKICFNLDEIQRCDSRIKLIKDKYGMSIVGPEEYYVILKTGMEIPIFNVDYEKIKEYITLKKLKM